IDCFSFPIGTTTLAERFLDPDKSNDEQINNLEQYIKEQFLSFPWIENDKDLPLICIGGTLRNLCKIDMHRKNYSYKKIHNYTMETTNAIQIYDDYKFSDLKTRQNIPGLAKERANIFISGIGILKCFIEINQPKNIVMSGCGLREGIFFDYLIKNQSNYRKASVLQASLDNAIKYYHINEAHAYQVCKLGLSMFEQLKPLHNLGQWEKKLLTVATLLHDCGVTINYYDKHKHNFYVISNSTFYGLEHREILISAFITSEYEHPDIQNAWQNYKNILRDGDDIIIKKLATILRLAESFDKSETGIVMDLICNINEDEAVIKLISGENTQLEIANASKYAQEFYQVFNKKLRVL
ncbi:MAG: Ppx/GppA family phosphatase, partial [Mahellales bacterium]